MNEYRSQKYNQQLAMWIAGIWMTINVGMLLFQWWPTVMKAIAGFVFIFIAVPLALAQLIRKDN